MSSQRYPEEFKTEAVKQILDHGHSVADVSNRLGVSPRKSGQVTTKPHALAFTWSRLEVALTRAT